MLENITSNTLNSSNESNNIKDVIENIASDRKDLKNICKQKDYVDPYDAEYKIIVNNKAGRVIHRTTQEDENKFLDKLNSLYKNTKKSVKK